LKENLNDATFGGWASAEADEAICWLIVKEEWELMHVMANDNAPFLPRVNFEVWSDDVVEKVVKLDD
jgi:hypothetical protein